MSVLQHLQTPSLCFRNCIESFHFVVVYSLGDYSFITWIIFSNDIYLLSLMLWATVSFLQLSCPFCNTFLKLHTSLWIPELYWSNSTKHYSFSVDLKKLKWESHSIAQQDQGKRERQYKDNILKMHLRKTRDFIKTLRML